MSIRETITKELDELRRMRDEAKLQASLGKAEAKDAITRLEARWPELERLVAEIERAREHPVEELGRGARAILREMMNEYEKITAKLKRTGT
jgi:hypothetical protein